MSICPYSRMFFHTSRDVPIPIVLHRPSVAPAYRLVTVANAYSFDVTRRVRGMRGWRWKKNKLFPVNRRPKCIGRWYRYEYPDPGKRILRKHVKNIEMEKRSSARSPRYTDRRPTLVTFSTASTRKFISVFDGKSIYFVLSDGETRFDRSRGNRCSSFRGGGGNQNRSAYVPRAHDRRPTALCRFVCDLCRAPLDRLLGTTSLGKLRTFCFSPNAFPADTAFNRPPAATSRPRRCNSAKIDPSESAHEWQSRRATGLEVPRQFV